MMIAVVMVWMATAVTSAVSVSGAVMVVSSAAVSMAMLLASSAGTQAPAHTSAAFSEAGFGMSFLSTGS